MSDDDGDDELSHCSGHGDGDMHENNHASGNDSHGNNRNAGGVAMVMKVWC